MTRLFLNPVEPLPFTYRYVISYMISHRSKFNFLSTISSKVILEAFEIVKNDNATPK